MALDPSLLNDLDAMRAAGTLPPLQPAGATPAAPGALPSGPRPGEVGYRGGATDFRGSQFATPGPALAATRAAAGAVPPVPAPGVASAAAAAPGLFSRLFATGTLLAQGAGAAEQVAATTAGATEENRLERALQVLSGLDITGVGKTIGDVLTGRTAQTAPVRATAAALVPARATAAAPTPTPAPQPEPIVAITNPDGSISYTNVRHDMLDTIERGGTMREITPETSRGTVNTIPGVTATQKAQALSASLRDREFGTARAIATTPEQIQQVDTAEKLFDAQQGVLTARTRRDRVAAERNLANLQATIIAGEGTKAAQTRALAELLKGAPAAAKAAAETTAITNRNSLIDSLLKKKSISATDAAVLYGGGTLEKPTTAVTPSLVPGQPSEVIQVRGGQARQLPVQQPMIPGQIYTDPNTGTQYQVDANRQLQPLRTR